MKRLAISSALVISLTVPAFSPAHAAYFRTVSISNGYLDASTNFAQNTENGNGIELVDGENSIQIKLSRPKVPNFNCPSNYKVRAIDLRNVYVEATYNIAIYDDKFKAEEDGEHIWRSNTTINLGSNLLPITQQPSRDNSAFRIDGRLATEKPNTKNILDFFSYDGNTFLSKVFNITLTGGQKLFINQSITYFALCEKIERQGGGETISAGLEFLDKTTIDSIDIGYKLVNQSINFKPIKFGILNDKFIKIDANSTNNLPLSYTDLTSKTCITNNGVINLKKNGACRIAVSQEGDIKNIPAKPVVLSFNIYSKSPGSKFKAIICENDEAITTATGLKPKCPKGYK